jgi:hypothetical protein
MGRVLASFIQLWRADAVRHRAEIDFRRPDQRPPQGRGRSFSAQCVAWHEACGAAEDLVRRLARRCGGLEPVFGRALDRSDPEDLDPSPSRKKRSRSLARPALGKARLGKWVGDGHRALNLSRVGLGGRKLLNVGSKPAPRAAEPGSVAEARSRQADCARTAA